MVRRLTIEDLHRAFASLPAEIRDIPGGPLLPLANAIMGHFLGHDWLPFHVRVGGPPGFMRLDFSSDRRREASAFRVIHLAELLFNLQFIKGFDSCVTQMRHGAEKVESTYAELDVGRLLYLNDVEFSFVEPQSVRGTDYDFELRLFGSLDVPADAKCKFETTAISPDSVRNSLEKARKQLPRGRPGIIFIKVPQAWITDPTVATALARVAENFLRNTERVISVKFYVSHVVLEHEMVGHFDQYREITNTASRFYEGRDWDVFPAESPPLMGWNGWPAKWQRLIGFPGSVVVQQS